MKVSEFIGTDIPGQESPGVDLTGAERIFGGSICDAYKVRFGHRLVFVKKLKDKYSGSPRHISALEKEFEIGTSLGHPSLPTYLFSQHNYVVMNYIEGETLQALIAANDPWLSQGENCLKLISDLVSVTEYLHRRGVMHCDIKSDNILVCKDTNNIYLIDLDKCYTSWHDLTAGSPTKYGLTNNEIGNPQIDLNGISEIARILLENTCPSGCKSRLKKFFRLCHREGVTFAELRGVLEVSHRPGRSLLFGLVAVLIALVVIIIFLILRLEELHSDSSNSRNAVLVASDTTRQYGNKVTQKSNQEQSGEDDEPEIIPVRQAVDDVETHEKRQGAETSNNTESPQIDISRMSLHKFYDSFMNRAQNIIDVLNEKQEINAPDSLIALSQMLENCNLEAVAAVKAQYSSIPQVEAEIIVVSTPEYERAKKKYEEVNNAITALYLASEQ